MSPVGYEGGDTQQYTRVWWVGWNIFRNSLQWNLDITSELVSRTVFMLQQRVLSLWLYQSNKMVYFGCFFGSQPNPIGSMNYSLVKMSLNENSM